MQVANFILRSKGHYETILTCYGYESSVSKHGYKKMYI